MGERGPIPKPAEERVRRNKTGEDGIETSKYELDAEVKIPTGVTFIHPSVKRMWEALKTSVNRKFYEPTDWAYAVLTLELWDDILSAGKRPGAMELSALDSMLSKMLMTEADRRRLKIETKRGTGEEKKTTPGASEFYKEAFERQGRLRAVPSSE